MNLTRLVHCMNALFDKLMGLCYGTYFPMHDVMVYILLAIFNSHGLYVGSVLPCLKTLGGIKCCVRFSIPRNPVKTFACVKQWKGVLFACVKQW